MRFLVDAKLPRSAVPLLARLGYHVEHVRDLGLHAAPDAQIAAYARLSRAIILSRDLDFADVRSYPPADYFGIVVLRLPEDSTASQILVVLESFLRQLTIVEQLPGRLAIVEVDRFRIRPSLD